MDFFLVVIMVVAAIMNTLSGLQMLKRSRPLSASLYFLVALIAAILPFSFSFPLFSFIICSMGIIIAILSVVVNLCTKY